jgi:hypothetical protein
MTKLLCPLIVLWLTFALAPAVLAAENVFPPLAAIKPDRPRLLVRPTNSALAIPLAELRALPRDRDVKNVLDRLSRTDDAAAHAMRWLMTGDAAAADKAIAKMRAYRKPAEVDTFHVYLRLREFALAYDWLHDCPAFDRATRDQVRSQLTPVAREGLRLGDDHVFHNYTWMSCGGVSLWALATAGEDAAADEIFNEIRRRFNDRLLPTLEYLDGLPSEPMGYWSHYVFTPAVTTLLAAQSATETDLVSAVRTGHGDWLNRNLQTLIHGTLPDMRFIPWGDLQGGSHGGVTQEMAGVTDAAAWALRSPEGQWFDEWLAGKRGVGRFAPDTGMYYVLYTRRLDRKAASAAPSTQPAGGAVNAVVKAPPALSFMAGGHQGGHFIARSGWGDSDTVIAFRCADYLGAHHHYDQGSFLMYRRGLLAVDPPVYKHVGPPQNQTEHHNALLIGGKPQRPARGQSFATLESFQKNLTRGKRLETGDVTFWHDAGAWAAVAGQYAQAYDCPELQSCVRQLLFVRPGGLLVVDRLLAVSGKQVPEISWLLQFPSEPRREGEASLVAKHGKAWIRCQAVLPGGTRPAVDPTPVNTHRATYTYAGGAEVILVHWMEVGDGVGANEAGATVKAVRTARGVEVNLGDAKYVFEMAAPFKVFEERP